MYLFDFSLATKQYNLPGIPPYFISNASVIKNEVTCIQQLNNKLCTGTKTVCRYICTIFHGLCALNCQVPC